MKSITLLYDQYLKTNAREASTSGAGKYPPRKKSLGKKRSVDEKPTSVEEITAMIVHEIRNPLTAISLANQSLYQEIRDRDLPGTLHTLAGMVSKNISRIETLLKELLSTKCDAELVAVDICDVLESSLEKADDRIFLKKLDVSRCYRRGLFINGNVEKLSMVFLNIIINAIEAVDEEKGNLWITAYRAKDEVKVIFKDNGYGMEPEVASHMFDRNFSGKSKGLGVGMAHVKEILQWHNASITVNSEPGTGTTIIVVFKGL